MANPQSPQPSLGLSNMDELARVFARFDTDGDGRISASELDGIFRALGSDASPQEVLDMIAEMDADRDGFVDFHEFAAFHRNRDTIAGGAAEAELRDAFRVYDIDQNGLISAQELHHVLSRLGEKCSLDDCSMMIKSVDTDGDGNVSFEEFKKMMMKGPPGAGGSSHGGAGEKKAGGDEISSRTET